MKLLEILNYVVENPGRAFYYTPPNYNNSKSYFFKDSCSELKIFPNDDIISSLKKVDEKLDANLIAYGYISYELGLLLEDRLQKIPINYSEPLLHLKLCEKESLICIESNSIDYSDIDKIIGEKVIANFELNVTKSEYLEKIKRIKNYIQQGDTYQVNYTVNSHFDLQSSVEQLFAQIIFTQSAPYSAIINLGDKIIVSSSPELFFEIIGKKIIVKPMKGTIRRGKNLTEDELKKNELLESEKDRAENIMIVDLLRNDIGRVCEYGTVKLNKKYSLESYESVHQLTSEIEGSLRSVKFSDIINNLFPSGSITGAPKIRTMEIIAELEKEPRGIYTGLIGLFSKDFTVANVAIRTITVDRKTRKANLGVGSGIVWDSNAESEYDEVLLKSKFLTEPMGYFELFETMLYEDGNIFLLKYHFDRLKATANYFLFNYNESFLKSELESFTSRLDKKYKQKIKMRLNKWGAVKFEVSGLMESDESIDIILSNQKIDSENKYQYFKTTNRTHYENEFKKHRNTGYYEVIYLNENNNITEGSFTNILIESDTKLITPPIRDGILNGCYRQYLLNERKNIIEESFGLNKILNSKRIILINSVRKEIIVNKIFNSNGILLRDFD